MNGGTPKTGIAENWGGPHWWITPAEMGKRSSPYADHTERKLTDLGLQNSSAQLLPPYSVILSSRAPIGHLVINTKPMATNQGCKGLVPGSLVDHKFLFYYLSSIVGLLNDLGTGTTFKELSGGALKAVDIPVPSIPEQRRIVRTLDEVIEAVEVSHAATETNLHNVRELLASELQAIFTEPSSTKTRARLGDVATFRNGINYTKSSRGQVVKVVGVGDFRDRYWAPLDSLSSVRVDGDIGPGDRLHQGDILVVRSNGNPKLIGRCVLVGEVAEDVTHSGFTIRIRLSGTDPVPEFLCYFLKSRASRRALSDAGTGTNIRSLSQGVLASLAVPQPPVAVQEDVVRRLDTLSAETERLADSYRRRLASLDALRQSLLHHAFTGAL